MTQVDAAVVGAGLAGLCCARKLHRQGLDVCIYEASDEIGGRIQTDEMDGFILDHGFQVFLTSYPEAQSVLDLNQLRLNGRCPNKRRLRFKRRNARYESVPAYIFAATTLIMRQSTARWSQAAAPLKLS